MFIINWVILRVYKLSMFVINWVVLRSVQTEYVYNQLGDIESVQKYACNQLGGFESV